MNTRNTLALCSAILMALAPSAVAHLNAGVATNTLADNVDGAGSNQDGCRYLDAASATECVPNLGPSGTYVNAGNGFFAEVGSMPFGVDVDTLFGITFFPNGWYGTGSFGTFCDLEVLSDSVPANGDEELDETTVDDTGSQGGTTLQDGNIDDGGDGAVCHVRSYGGDPAYNALGCAEEDVDADGSSQRGYAYAEDRVSAGDVWLTANCDWESFTNDEGGGLNCLINEIIQARNPVTMAGCVGEIIAGVLTPVTFIPTPVCGGDGGSDGPAAYGRGGGDEADAGSGDGVQYPAMTNGCDAQDATASAAVMHSIQTDGPTVTVDVATNSCATVCQSTVGSDGSQHVSVYTVGWIDWNNTGDSVHWSNDGGVQVNILPDDMRCTNTIDEDLDGTADDADCDTDPLVTIQDDCADGLDNDNDGDVDGSDSDCQAGGSGNESTGIPSGSCANFFDDDGDDASDADDADCHIDGDETNPQSYDPTREE